MKVRMHLAYGWHTNARDVECITDAIRKFKPHLVLGESSYMPQDAKLGLERKFEAARRRKDPLDVRRMFEGTGGTLTLSGTRIDISRPVIEFCVEQGIRFMYDELWPDIKQAHGKFRENQETGKEIHRSRVLFLTGRVTEAVAGYRAVLRKRIEGLLERDENSYRYMCQLLPILPLLNGIKGLEEVRILNRIGLYHVGRFEKLRTDRRFEVSCSFETHPPVFGELGAIMARGGMGLEVRLDNDIIMRAIICDLIVNHLDPMETWSPLFIATAHILANMLEGDSLHRFGSVYGAIVRQLQGVPEPTRTTILLGALSEYFGVHVPLNEQEMLAFVRQRFPEFSTEPTECDAQTKMQEFMGSGRIIE
ncbi:MAG: hypothetical protein ABID61_01565 [Candidatus Micrarchaeota archaeon]